ncbi:MAG: dienelactone hydrolase family protein [Myxococcales bacterium]|nr:dienelactone hydrolase family protein [Myxococcales bacterium]
MRSTPRLRRATTLATLLATTLATTTALTLGCGPTRAPPAPPQTADEAPPAEPAASPAPKDTGLTGALSEEEFKALHELRGDAAPAPRGEMIELAGARAYLSLPEGQVAPIPGVVVIHEWWGLNEHIQHWADRLAADGYAALAVDLYGGQVATDPEGAMALMKTVDEAKAAAVLKAAHELLASDARIKAPRRGVVGWCFGGGWSLRHAMATPDLDAAVIYYGRLVTDPSALEGIHAQLLGVFGDQDGGIPPEAVQEFKDALAKAGKSIELHTYDANHAFANPSSGRYDQQAAADAWSHVRAFFGRALKTPAS